jgi:hypothetical protein
MLVAGLIFYHMTLPDERISVPGEIFNDNIPRVGKCFRMVCTRDDLDLAQSKSLSFAFSVDPGGNS